MGPVSFVIAILGCADGAASCRQVGIAPQRFESAARCEAATANVLAANTDFDFPTLVARCQTSTSPAAAPRPAPHRTPGAVRQG